MFGKRHLVAWCLQALSSQKAVGQANCPQKLSLYLRHDSRNPDILVLRRMLGPLVGGYLAVWGGFSAPFYAAALIGILMIPIPILMPDREQHFIRTLFNGGMITCEVAKIEIAPPWLDFSDQGL